MRSDSGLARGSTAAPRIGSPAAAAAGAFPFCGLWKELFADDAFFEVVFGVE